MIEISSLPEAAQKALAPDAPEAIKTMAASGKLPIPSEDKVSLLYFFIQGEDKKLAQMASRALEEDDKAVNSVLDNKEAEPELLALIGKEVPQRKDYIQRLILHSKCPDETIAWLAERVDEKYLEIICQNQDRQLRYPPLVKSILSNPTLLMGMRAQVIEFAARNGMDTGLSHEELVSIVGQELADSVAKASAEEVAEMVASASKNLSEEVANRTQFEAGEMGELAEEEIAEEWVLEAAEEEADEEVRLTLEQKISRWTVSEKIKAALKGDRRVRNLLIRDSNRLVSSAVMNNPRITEPEIVMISASRNASDDIIRQITLNREWMKLYQVKVNLVNNPKCPTSTALRLLPHLRVKDLRSLLNNKNVPNVISVNAKKFYRNRQGR